MLTNFDDFFLFAMEDTRKKITNNVQNEKKKFQSYFRVGLTKPNPSVNTETIMCQKKAWPSQKVLYI